MKNKAALLPNIVGFPSESMRRYASELAAALHALPQEAWEFQEADCRPAGLLEKFLGDRMASREARFLAYPRLIRSLRGVSAYHILDHSHANLALACPPSRTVLTCHDIIPLLAARGLVSMPVPFLTRFTFPLRIFCMKRCRKIIAISHSTKKTLVEVGGVPAEKIEVVYYGCNPAFGPEPASPGERAEVFSRWGIPEDARLLLHVATPMRYKNSPAIVSALARLKEDAGCGPVWLLRVGADFFEDEAALVTRLGVGDRIRFAGRISDDRLLGACYRAADVFVFPSLWEGFGWPVLEAMSCGTPVVVSDVASLPEVAGEAGIAVPPHDHAALAAAIRSLLRDPAEHRMRSEKALQHAKSFTWDACARNTLAVYEQVAARADGDLR